MMEAVIPRGWLTATLREIAQVRLGRQRSPEKANGPYMQRYLRAANVTWKGIDLTDIKEMSFSPEECETYALRDGDILLSEASGSPLEVGKPAIWRQELPLCCFQNTLIRVRPTEPSLVRFLHLHFMKDAVTGRFAEASRGVGIHHLGAAAIADWQVQLPPAPEQGRIVEAIDSYLTRLDDAVSTLERVQRNLKRYRASVLKAAVEGRLVPTEAELARAEKRDYEPASKLLERILVERRRRWEEAELAKMKASGKVPRDDGWKAKYEEPAGPDTSELPELPEGWCWATFDQITIKITKGSSPNWQGFEYTDSGVLFVRSQNIGWGCLELSERAYLPPGFNEQEPRSILQENDVLLNIVGASIGRAAVATTELAGSNINQAVALIRLVSEGVLSSVVVAYLLSPNAQRLIHHTKVDVARANLSLADIAQMPFPLPPCAEQIRLAGEINRLSTIADRLTADTIVSSQRCTRLRQSILKWAFEGKLVDQDPTDEPASVLLERIRAERAAPQENKTASRKPGRPAKRS